MIVEDLPTGNTPKALEYFHFPSRFQAVIWRNWNLVSINTLAKVLHASPQQIEQTGCDLGLIRRDNELDKWEKRGFQTIIRRNWELLDYEQLLELLNWSPEQLAFTLKEDDFLFYKLGLSKPKLPKVYYRELSLQEREQTANIRKIVQTELTAAPLLDPPFAFLQRYGSRPIATRMRKDFNLKMIYSYSALYGDPLQDDNLDSYPEGLLSDYASCGVNGIWIQGTLYTLIPWLGENNPYSSGWQHRLENLQKLVKRAAKYGIKVILYFNEPRAMPKQFFAQHPDWKGACDESGDNFALCISNPLVLQALSSGIKRLFTEVPNLGGLFTITMSENLTHCQSRGSNCPRCQSHSCAELITMVNNTIAKAMHSIAPQAHMIAYTWGWQSKWQEEVINNLTPDITIMTVSESGLPTSCLGHPGRVNDYSISKVGPGKNAQKIWKSALKNGAPAVAKIQINCSWEISPVPYIPVPDLIEEHLNNLRNNGVSDLMLSWTLGGYPGGNLELLRANRENLAKEKFGEDAHIILNAWSCFSNAFAKYFPFNDVSTLYFAPQNYGPMTILFKDCPNRDASMVGFPFDDIDTWRGAKSNAAAPKLYVPFPPEILEESFRLLSVEWGEGLALLKTVNPAIQDLTAWKDLHSVAETIYCHFRSTYLQIRWTHQRGNLEILQEEKELAHRLLIALRQDSRLGYEASNHYLYTENDLLEKIINCYYLENSCTTAISAATGNTQNLIEKKNSP